MSKHRAESKPLVVSDDKADCRVIAEALEASGLGKPHQVNTISKAAAYLERTAARLLIVDLDLDLHEIEKLIDCFWPELGAGDPLILGIVPTARKNPDWNWEAVPDRVGQCIKSPIEIRELQFRLTRVQAAPGFVADHSDQVEPILFGGMGDECILSDPESGKILSVNSQFLERCGGTTEVWQAENLDAIGLASGPDVRNLHGNLLNSEGHVEFRCKRRLKGRRPFPVLVKQRTGHCRGKPAVITVIQDISREGALERYMKVLASSYQGAGQKPSTADLVDRIGETLGLDYLMIAAGDGAQENSLTVNAAYCRTEEVRDLIDLKDSAAYAQLLAGEEVVAAESAWENLEEAGFLRAQRIESYVGLPLVGTKGKVNGLMIAAGKRRLQEPMLALDLLKMAAGHFAKLQEIRRLEVIGKNLGLHDSLTKLPNRILFLDRISHAIRAAKRTGEVFAVLFVDLDRFKSINDSLGHDIGDEVLVAVSERLLANVRSGDTVARHAGDEFTIILRHIVQNEDVLRIAHKINSVLDSPLPVGDNHELYTTASVGVSFFPEDGDTPEVLIKHADTAMYNAKNLGRNNCQIYVDTDEETHQQKLMLESKLRKAEENNELRVFFQPKVLAETEDIHGMEALIRWEHPELGLISPGFFVPLAEETGLIVGIGSWLLRRACQRTREWQKRFEIDLRVGVNLSPVQLRQPDLVEIVDRALTDTALHPSCLDLEITESISIKSIVGLEEKLAALRELGCSVSIDDFGTGQASLDYLKRFPADCIKIDQSFVRHIGVDRGDEAIIEATISMAHQLGMSVVAEGVEEEHHVAFLKTLGCELLQGYLFCRPQSEDGFARLLLEREALCRADPNTLEARGGSSE